MIIDVSVSTKEFQEIPITFSPAFFNTLSLAQVYTVAISWQNIP